MALLDPWVGGSALAILASVGLGTYLVLPLRSEMATVESALRVAVADSVSAAAVALTARTVETRRDSIAARVALIRRIDDDRYRWPRILSQVANALPLDVWLTHLSQVDASERTTRFQIEGVAPDNLALTRFWDALESATAIGGVSLLGTEVVETSSGRGHLFVLQAESQGPGGPPPAALRHEEGR